MLLSIRSNLSAEIQKLRSAKVVFSFSPQFAVKSVIYQRNRELSIYIEFSVSHSVYPLSPQSLEKKQQMKKKKFYYNENKRARAHQLKRIVNLKNVNSKNVNSKNVNLKNVILKMST
jgi:hypothetical protein